jgi:hypothetical protein
MTRPIPLLNDIPLELVQRIEHRVESGFIATRIAGLPGELQQRSGRPSHRVFLTGLLFGESAADNLSKLQTAAIAGEEITFAADITTALDLQKVVITDFRAVEDAGTPGRYQYELWLTESKELPPPAELDAFGGLGDFGLGDLGFDTDMFGDLQDLAGEIAGAVDAALDVVNQLSALANIGDLAVGNFLEPVTNVAGQLGGIGSELGEAVANLSELFSG